MKWSLQWIASRPNGEFSFDETISFLEEDLKNISNLKALPEVNISGTGKLDIHQDLIVVNFAIKGKMILICNLSLEDVEYPFTIDASEVFSLTKSDDDDIHEIKGKILDITSLVFQHILLEIPTRVVKPNAKIVSSGKGWNLVDEQSDTDDNIDPRFAKLKELFKE